MTGPASRMPLDPDRNLALELVRATEAALLRGVAPCHPLNSRAKERLM
jgi:hypothetical protein